MAMKYVTGNLIDSDTLDSVSSEDASGFYDKENLYNKIQALPLRFTSKSGEYVIIDLGLDLTPTFAGIYNHNLTTSPGTFKLKGYLQATGKPVDGSEAEDWDEDFTVTSGHLNSYKTFSETARYLALLITDASNTAMPELGELVVGYHSSFTRNFVYPYQEILRYIRRENVTPYGQRWRNQKSKVKQFMLDFLGITDANLLSEIEAFFEALDGDDPFVFIPDDSAAYSWYVDCISDLDAERASYNYNNVSVELVEQSRGFTLL